ncbi:hypothetical protein JYQ62_08275 [Nostoc sp. UHCC 0702]|nr:hypothetical protein JYQ62_08275 [Nostoc sp. UHCC 0702]
MKFDANMAGFLLASVSASSGWIVWWINKIRYDKHIATQNAAEVAKKEYAAQRDFEHLKNNLKQMSEAITHGFDDIDERFNTTDKELLRIQAYFIQAKTDRE